MDKKIFIIAIAALIVGGLALAGVILKQPPVPAELTDLRGELEKVKAGLPPTWGGWPATGYMIRVKDGPTLYFSGDTDLMLNWEAISEYYAPDIVIATHSVLYQMGVKEWVYVINKIRPKYVLASHHGSFPFYPETDDDFVKAITEKTPATGIKLPEPGQEFELMGLKITWLGHASFIIETPQGSRIAFDPEWNAVNLEGFPAEFKNSERFAADLILISHGHFDHFDPLALKVLMVPTQERTPHLGMLFEFAAYTQKLLPQYINQIVPFNMGVWIDKEILEEAYGAKMTHLSDIEFAAIFASHSSGIFSPIK